MRKYLNATLRQPRRSWRLPKGVVSFLVALLLLGPAVSARADQLYFTFTDPVGDNTGPIDVTQMSVTFDNGTGAYEIVLRATTLEPFLSQFRINVNLWNPTASSFFQDAGNDFNLSTGVTVIVLTGTNLNLPAWHAGDVVATNTLAGLGNPPGSTFFRTSVISPPFTFLTNEDAISFGPAGSTVLTTLMPQQSVELLTAKVDVLLESGTLSPDQAAGLRDKLSAAIAALNQGRSRAACGQLSAFENQVNAFLNSGALSPQQGQELRDAAAAIHAQIGC